MSHEPKGQYKRIGVLAYQLTAIDKIIADTRRINKDSGFLTNEAISSIETRLKIFLGSAIKEAEQSIAEEALLTELNHDKEVAHAI